MVARESVGESRLYVQNGNSSRINLNHPNLMEIFQEAVGDGFTNAGLERALKKGLKPATESVRKRPFSLYRRSVQSMRSGIEEQVRRLQEKRSGGAADRSAGARRPGGGTAPGGPPRWQPHGGGAEEKTDSRVADTGAGGAVTEADNKKPVTRQ